MFGLELPLLSFGGVSLALIGGALALGFRHGIDWDHIAAITDITSTAAPPASTREARLISEPGVLLTNESDHSISGEAAVHSHGRGAHTHEAVRAAVVAEAPAQRRVALSATLVADAGVGAVRLASAPVRGGAYEKYVRAQSRPWTLGTMYALGHGTVVTILGLLAILASEVLPAWIDPIMERVVGVTLVLLSVYLFYSLFTYFRGDGEFRIRSRWMIVFAGVRNGIGWLRARFGAHEHTHAHAADQYGARTAYGIGMIHGVGAETGTQALIIATAAGASTKATSVVVLLMFVAGLLASNTLITIMSTSGFVSAQRRQWVYVAAGMFAAVFSLVVGVIFLAQAGTVLPEIGRYFEWLGGPKS